MKDWKHKLSNHAQLGGIETSVLDNGPGRGTRIAWINTGTGLRYKVVIDRGLDIADAFYNQYSLAWLSSRGIVPPQLFPDRGTGWLRTFGGGLLTTCGLTHVGGPEKDEFGERGLHGLVSNTPAEIVAIQQPDPANGLLDMSVTGIIRETQLFGPSLELKRTISGTIGEASIRIHDEITNAGNTVAPHMLLYHFNFGWPLVDEGTSIIWKGEWKPRDGDPANRIFNKSNNFHKCPAPMDAHGGSGEDVVFVDIASDADGNCAVGLNNEDLAIAAVLRFRKEQLPWFINWQHWGTGEYVTGLEPATHPPYGQSAARERNELILLKPGERRTYDLQVEVLTDAAKISAFAMVWG